MNADFPEKTVLGLTGGVGSGKSLVLEMMKRRYGAVIIEADRVAEEVMNPGGISYERAAALFGPSVVREDGFLDRGKIRRMVFDRPELLKELNGIVHPDTGREVRRRIETAESRLVVYEAALPREAEFEKLCDAVIFVFVPEEIRIRRLMLGRNYSREQSRSIIRRQLSEEEFRALSDLEIDNSGTPEETEAALDELMLRLGIMPAEEAGKGE